MPPLDKPLKLDKEVAQPVGDTVQMLHLHIGLTGGVMLHLGYAVGKEKAGTFESKQALTKPIPVASLSARYPVNGPTVEAAIQALVDASYALLQEAGEIGPGTRA